MINGIHGILLVGKMASGKGSVTNYIRDNYGYVNHSMAYWLKSTVMNHYNLNRIDKAQVINGKSIRTILQEVGVGMRNIDPNWHIDEVVNSILRDAGLKFIIDDIRFINEQSVLTNKFKCVTIRIMADELKRIERICIRDGMVPTTKQLNHISETEIDRIPYDITIFNNGSINDLHNVIRGVMNDVNG